MQNCGTCVEQFVLTIDGAIDFVVNRAGCLHIEHKIAKSVVRVTKEVVVSVNGSAIKVSISILGVATFFVCIY